MFVVVALAVTTAQGYYVDPDPPHRLYRVYSPSAAGVVVDLHGPPKGGTCKITWSFYTTYPTHPSVQDEVHYGNYNAEATDSEVVGWGHQGLVVRKAGTGRVRIIGYKQDGWLLPVTKVKITSRHLPLYMLPKVVWPPKKPGA